MTSRFFSRVMVLGAAAWHRVGTMGRRRRPVDPRRILVAHNLLLGDTLMLTPLLAKLRRNHPQAEIVMTVPPAFVPLYQHRPYGVRVVPYDPRRPDTVVSLMRDKGFDLALVPGDNRLSWLALALKSRWIVAFDGDRPAYKTWPVDARIAYPDKPAALAELMTGLAEGPPPARYRTRQWPAPDHDPFDLPRRPYCVLHVGARTTLKLWPPANWLSLADTLSSRGYTVVWSGGPREQRLVDEVDPEGSRTSYAGRLDLPQLWHLLENAALLVCPDTSVAHLGRVIGVPTIALFGPGNPDLCGAGEFWADSPYVGLTERDVACRNQHTLFKRNVPWLNICARNSSSCPAHVCMSAISVRKTLETADRFLDSNENSRETNNSSSAPRTS